MSKYKPFFLIFLLATLMIQAQSPLQFEDYFIDATMRIDYFHSGDVKQESVTIDRIYREGVWAGSQKNLIDNFNHGKYYFKIYDCLSGKLIFSRGFNSYFGEYQTTTPALKKVARTYHESALIPYPKKQIHFSLEKRDRKNNLISLFSYRIDPAAICIAREGKDNTVKVIEVLKNGKPAQKVDIAFIAEGYTSEEYNKFSRDLKRFCQIFFHQQPYQNYQKSFNIYGVFKASPQSGCDEPRRKSYKNTVIDVSFNSLNSARYLMTEANRKLRDLARHVPYDTLCIMVNHSRYGGGGIYRLYCTFPADNEWHKYLLLHEFGHSFSGLADEYYSSSTAYNDFYPPGVEPTAPNITALLDKETLKWQKLLTPQIKIPTPWRQNQYDNLSKVYWKTREQLRKKILQLQADKAAAKAIDGCREQLQLLSKKYNEAIVLFLSKHEFAGKVGAFEGAGYSARGLYRPMLDCIMFSKGAKPYCKVCHQAVIRMIKFYSE